MFAVPEGRCAVVLFACLAFHAGSAAAQTGCRLAADPARPDRLVLRCGEALQVEGEPGARFTTINLDSDREPEGVGVTEGRVLARVQPQNAPVAASGRRQPRRQPPFEFQIRTPHAIASVRGTIWAIGVRRGRTSIYVKDGRVRVQRLADGATRTMICNQGVDIGSGDAGPLEVHDWGLPRADQFLRPFGLQGGCPGSEGARRRPRNFEGGPGNPGRGGAHGRRSGGEGGGDPH